MPEPHTEPAPTHDAPTHSTLDVHHITLDSIDQGEQLIRQDQNDDEITELAADIAAHGLMQPIGVAPKPDGRYQLLFGARRLAAHRRLRARTIAATFHDVPEDSIRATAARENILRRQLTLTEECDVVAQLHHQEHRSPDQIASLLSRSRAWVLRRLAIPGLPLELREPLLEGNLTVGHAEALALIEDEGLRRYALTQVRASAYSVGDTKQMVEALRADPSIAAAVAAGIEAGTSTATPLVIMAQCAGCHTPRPLEDLVIVRVCKDGCDNQE